MNHRGMGVPPMHLHNTRHRLDHRPLILRRTRRQLHHRQRLPTKRHQTRTPPPPTHHHLQAPSSPRHPLPVQHDFFEPFEMTAASEIGPKTSLSTADRTFEPKKDFIPLSFSKEGSFKGPVVFAGYGIASDEHHYNDYANLDIKDKVVL